MILLIDNYDSFTYNLVQRLGELDAGHRCARLPQRPDHARSGRGAEAERTSSSRRGPARRARPASPTRCCSRFAATVPILGVCLGHQCIGHVFGGEVIRNYRVMHGKTSPIHHDNQGVFRGLSNPFEATRYHSLVIRRETFHNPDFVSPPGPRKARSWACGTAPGRCTACSSTRRVF